MLRLRPFLLASGLLGGALLYFSEVIVITRKVEKNGTEANVNDGKLEKCRFLVSRDVVICRNFTLTEITFPRLKFGPVS
jgi:hypothetical protein